MEGLKRHQGSVEVVESVCMLLTELAEHEELRELLVEKGAAEQLLSVRGNHVHDEVSDGRARGVCWEP